MSNIMYKDTDGDKSTLLPKGNLGYDAFPTGGDEGRVYVGTGTENIKQLSEKDGINSLVDVDIVTVAPNDGEALAWDETAGKWKPSSSSAAVSIDKAEEMAIAYAIALG